MTERCTRRQLLGITGAGILLGLFDIARRVWQSPATRAPAVSPADSVTVYAYAISVREFPHVGPVNEFSQATSAIYVNEFSQATYSIYAGSRRATPAVASPRPLTTFRLRERNTALGTMSEG